MSITIGDQNTAYGFASLRYLTSGSWNTAIGEYAGWEHSTADGNTFVGIQAGMTVKTGSYNVGIGSSVMRQSSPGGSYNTAIGSEALKFIGGSDGSAISNVAVGAYALHISDYGKRNVAVGRDAGKDVSSGNDNVLIGYRAGESLWAGTGNVFIGSQVGSDASLQDENDLLMIDNSNTLTPLIQGDFSTNEIVVNGSLQAGQVRRSYKHVTNTPYTVTDTDCWMSFAQDTDVLLPDAATNKYRELTFITRDLMFLVRSVDVASSAVLNIQDRDGNLSSSIVQNTVHRSVTLVSDGTNWVVVQYSN